MPSSLVESLPVIDEIAENIMEEGGNDGNKEQRNQPGNLELDIVNKHPCMINLLRVIDYMHAKFYDETQASWMKPIY